MTIAERTWPGDPNRPALALHCSMGSSSYWGPIADRLEGVVSLSAFDAPGHGRSPDWRRASSGGVDYHTAVTRLAAARIGQPMDLIGHSLGATVALRIAVSAPQSVRSLTLIEPVLFAAAPGAEADPLHQRMTRLLEAGQDEEATRAFLSVWGDGHFDDLPALTQTRMIQQIRLVAEANDTLIFDRADILRDGGLEAIGVPVMLIRGSNSPPVIAQIADALAARLPDVARAEVPGAGHMLPITHPYKVADLIRVNLERS
ncbi:alpha/beta hydrolase [Paracoccus suum]|uniref:Alpha/beta hydrolase n=1 Tax=Paracoccus suum TaxID=2259340 RepID=A0A344PNH4_9RHOB|nr:alpha/beta hydrolase [Paracoccus suum]AXC50929.1 alpha/beta hydrolase [Paracoccus suum]